MPNWTQNRITVRGDKEKLKSLMEDIKSEKGPFDFNKIIPQPEIVKNTGSGMRMIDGANVTTWYQDNSLADHEEIEKSVRNFTDEERAEFKKIGHGNWYEWNCTNWGTKWNACEPEIDDDSEYNEIRINFNTAWTTPLPILEALRVKYPDLDFTMRYKNEDDYDLPHDADEVA